MQLLIMHRIYQFTFNNCPCIIIYVYDNTYFVVNHKIFSAIPGELFGGNQSTANCQSCYLGTCVTVIMIPLSWGQMQRSLCCHAQPYIVLWVMQDMVYCTNPLNQVLDDPAMALVDRCEMGSSPQLERS